MNSISFTLHRANNYGAVLQAYAFQQTLLSLGIDDKIVDEPLRNKTIFSKVSFDKGLNQAVRALIANATYVIKKKKIIAHNDLLVSFVNNNIKLTEKSYCADDELENEYPKADIYFTGSDQTFSIYSPLKNSRFLRYASASSIKASYATSMMDYPSNQTEKDWLKDSLINYDFLSVREEKLYNYLNTELGISSEVHVDPVFLLNPSCWIDMAEAPRKPIEGKYILFYPIVNSPELPKMIEKVKTRLGLPVISVQSPARRKTKGVDYYYTTATIPEFLGLFQNAEYIITSSFHGTAFSIIFKKQFTVYTGFEKADRITNILEKFGIPSRGSASCENMDFSSIEYEHVDKSIDKEIDRSKEYLQKVIGVLNK